MMEAKRDTRPAGSAILECTMAAAYQYALHMAGIASGEGYAVTVETSMQQLQVGQQPIPHARIDLVARNG